MKNEIKYVNVKNRFGIAEKKTICNNMEPFKTLL